MGYSKRCLAVAVLFMLVSTAVLPAIPGGPGGIEPPSVTLLGRGQPAKMDLPVVNNSVVLGATLDVEGGPVHEEVVIPSGADTALGFQGSVSFATPDPDLSWYLGDQLSADDLDNASAVDGKGVLTTAADYAYQLFLIDVDPVDLDSISMSWTGWGNHTDGAGPIYGAVMYVYENASKTWEILDLYASSEAAPHNLSGSPILPPWHYVNRTLTGEDKVILLVTHDLVTDTNLFTDGINVTATYASYPSPRLDVGSDGRIDWGFGTGAATGALGRVAAFDDSNTTMPITFPLGGGHNDSAAVLVPPGVDVQEAWVDYTPYPSLGERTGGGTGVTVPATSPSQDLQVTGIPLESHQKRSSVLLTNPIKLNRTEQVQEDNDWVFPLIVGYHPTGAQSLAQTFTPGYTGPLTGIDVYIGDKAESPGNLTMEISETQTGIPTGSVLRTVELTQSQIAINSWNHFSFNPVSVQEGTVYAFRLFALNSKQAPPAGYSIGYNQSGNYPNGVAFSSASLDGSTSWNAFMYDISFRTYMDYPIDEVEARNLQVLGQQGNMAGGRITFNVSDFDYEEGNWTFWVDNGNPFAVTFDWSAWTRYQLYAESPSLDVGGDGLVEWTGTNVSRTVPIDIAAGVQHVVDQVEWPHVHVDLWGNLLYRVPLNLSATTEGDVALHNIVVKYNGSVTTSDLGDLLDARRGAGPEDAEGMVHIDINVTSKSAGQFTVTSVDILYDLPPYALRFPDVEVPEDGEQVGGPIPLDTRWFDDHDNNDLEYTVVRESGDPEVTYNLTEANVLTFQAPQNWSGEAAFHLVARDTSNLTNRTNTFNVTVVPVNDPPKIVGLPEGMEAYFNVLMEVPIEIVDNDSPNESITITTSSSRVWGSVPNSTVYLLYPNSSVFERVEVNVSDGIDHTLYQMNVTPRASNEPPQMHLPEEFVMSLDAGGWLNLTPYADDMETASEDLVWSVVSSPEALVVAVHEGHMLQVIPVATSPGDHHIILSVTDEDENTVSGDLFVDLLEARRSPPVIRRGPDAVPSIVKVEQSGQVVLNLALIRYWYDQEDYNDPGVMTWEVNNLRPSLFNVDIDGDKKLTIDAFDTLGSGYFTLRLIDSDGDVSTTESVQVLVETPQDQGTSWLTWVVATIVLILVILLGMAISRRGEGPKPSPPVTPAKTEEDLEAPPTSEGVDASPPPSEAKPARMVQLVVIHESTSLVTQMTVSAEHRLDEDKEDELIELSTLFAQERFTDDKVGTIKAFKFDGTEVLVGKGMHYFLVARCTGNVFDNVAHEMKRSIVNIDVNLGDRLERWYPGQRVARLEEELKDLMAGNGG